MHRLIEKAKGEHRPLLETEAKELLEEYGITVPAFRLIKSEQDIKEINEFLGYPVVMKIVSPDIIHKSEAGGVKIGIPDEEHARKAYQDILSKVKEYNNKAQINGIITYQMCPASTEVIIGMMQDPHFGPVIMFGLGGIFVEVLKDISFRILPIKERDAEEMISEIKGYSILKGVRGEPPKDLSAIKEVLIRLSTLVMENPEIQEIDLNPILVYEKGVQVVDARIIL
ncbi:MAG: acetate--CoA ligase family protein [Atribacterota bacterium]|nr:acetate--CoA ligase family protein [Atribacterota bacterium]MDD4896296.1 acetate--CoA ligase family protein [Atribacterota bacterium]MDD5636687.1 acetate--CoA ligase family protein [Atribacterota bacterium]